MQKNTTYDAFAFSVVHYYCTKYDQNFNKVIDMTTGERIKELRRQHELLQSELGKKVGCSTQRISNIERGVTQLPADLATKIADVFEVTVEELTQDGLPNLYRLAKDEETLLQLYRSLEENDRQVLIRMFDMFLNSRKK